MIFYILIALFVILLLWILFGPVIIFMDTDRNRYLLTLPGVFSAKLVSNQDQFYFRVWVFFIPVKIDPFNMKRKKSHGDNEKPEKKKKSKKRSGNIKLITGAIRAIRIRKLKLNIDTDDFVLNAWLVPVFSRVNSENILMQVNFEGNNFLHMNLRTRISSLLLLLFRNR